MLKNTNTIEKVRFVCATRLSQHDFFDQSCFGQSLNHYKRPNVELELYANNKTGLSKIYNLAIDNAKNNPAILVFIHDDVFINDFFWYQHLQESLKKFDIVGLAGNLRRIPNQPGWSFLDTSCRNDIGNLSGIVAGGHPTKGYKIFYFGEPDQEVKLLDGLFLSVRSDTLVKNNLYFDERFNFHHYDLDFCRQAELKNLKLGTSKISVIHDSNGGYKTDSWYKSIEIYFNKWGD